MLGRAPVANRVVEVGLALIVEVPDDAARLGVDLVAHKVAKLEVKRVDPILAPHLLRPVRPPLPLVHVARVTPLDHPRIRGKVADAVEHDVLGRGDVTHHEQPPRPALPRLVGRPVGDDAHDCFAVGELLLVLPREQDGGRAEDVGRELAAVRVGSVRVRRECAAEEQDECEHHP